MVTIITAVSPHYMIMTVKILVFNYFNTWLCTCEFGFRMFLVRHRDVFKTGDHPDVGRLSTHEMRVVQDMAMAGHEDRASSNHEPPQEVKTNPLTPPRKSNVPSDAELVL